MPSETAMRYQFPATRGERASEVASTAVSNHRDAVVAALSYLHQLALEPLQRTIGAVRVEQEPAEVRPVADPVEPRGDRGERLIARDEAGHHEHRSTVARRHASSRTRPDP
jgi:hypothetical protein